MNNLMTSEKTMTSREIAGLTGKNHRDVLRDIRQLDITYYEMGERRVAPSYYKSFQNKRLPEFLLTKMQTFDLMTGYSTTLRIKVNRRWEELENKVLSDDEIVQQALIIQQKKIEVLSVKAQVADELAQKGGIFLPTTVGKIVMGKPNIFCQWLVDNKIMFRKGKTHYLAPMSPYDQKERGYFHIQPNTSKDSATPQSYFTMRGLCWIQAIFLKKNNLLQLDYSCDVKE